MIAAKLNDLEVRQHAGCGRRRRFRSFLLSRIPPADHQCGQLRVYGQLSVDELLLGVLVSSDRADELLLSVLVSWFSVSFSDSVFFSLSQLLLFGTIAEARIYSGTFSRGSLFSGCTIAPLNHGFRDGAQTASYNSTTSSTKARVQRSRSSEACRSLSARARRGVARSPRVRFIKGDRGGFSLSYTKE